MNSFSTHPLQSDKWAQFREKTGIKIVKGDNFRFSVHKIPGLPLNIGYLPKGNMPDKKMINEVYKLAKENNCIFVQFEPNIINSQQAEEEIKKLGLIKSAHPLFTKYTFILDLTKSEEELLKNMHPKTRYNIKIAQKHNVQIIEDDSDKAFNRYLQLTRETTKRQNFFAHTEKYHKIMWETLKGKADKNELSAHLFLAKYQEHTLAAWILFVYKDTLYYPYGSSSSKNRETMASNLMMWEAIKYGKELGLKKFDMWGALGPNPDEKDSWYGFHKFKQGYGSTLTEFLGSYDLVINKPMYQFYKLADKIRWLILKH